ncbi:MAG: transcriptional regulator, GntR family [Caulobacter sp.]|nr:transcriptional regulator, GntR family [Caulobacter sp.]
MDALRHRLEATGPLQGAALPINALAKGLGVSPTPVREALAMLAGEGAIVRTAAGYCGATHDPASLAGLYGLGRVLAVAAVLRSGPEGWSLVGSQAQDADALIRDLAAAADGALAAAHRRVHAQLVPFAAATRRALGDGEAERDRLLAAVRAGNAGEVGQRVRRYYDRRANGAARVLAASVGLLK